MSNVSVRPYRPTSTIPVSRRQVRRSAPVSILSPSFKRQLLGVLGAAALAVLGISQVFSWQSGRLANELAADQQVKKSLRAEHDALLAEREYLTSKSHIQAVAGVRLELFDPTTGQIHKM